MATTPRILPRDTVPDYLHPLLALFAAHGAGAFPVGGCVRDTLLGQIPHDWDVAVTTPPADTAALCEAAGYRVIPTGMKHGTVTVLLPVPGTDRREPVECTTCRTEGGYSDSRHPDAVSFTGRIEDDLARRDFTVNAMALAPADSCFSVLHSNADSSQCFSILDPFGGEADLAAGVIRCVGDPDTRFSEDALRMLRAVRFAVRLGFDLDPATRVAIGRLSGTLSRISRERIADEFLKTLCSAAPERGMALLCKCDLLPTVLPRGISPDGPGRLSDLPADPALRLACLQGGLTADAVAENLASLRLPNALRDMVTALLSGVADPIPVTPAEARAFRAAHRACAVDALRVRRARIPQSGSDTTDTDAVATTAMIDTAITLVRRSEELGEPVTLAELALGGRDLIALGIPPGIDLRDTLDALLALVLDDPAENTRERLTAEALRLKS